MSQGQYGSAVEYYEKSDFYSDSKEKILEAKYKYVEKSRNSDNITTYNYLKDLVDAQYKDSAEIYEKIYELSVNININNEEDDYYHSLQTVSTYNKWYCYIIVDGIEPGKTIDLMYSLKLPNGENDEGWIKDAENKDIFSYEVSMKDNPMNRKTGIATFSVYDENGQLLAEKSVELIESLGY